MFIKTKTVIYPHKSQQMMGCYITSAAIQQYNTKTEYIQYHTKNMQSIYVHLIDCTSSSQLGV